MKKGANYYYDDLTKNYDIQEVTDLKKLLLDINPYIALYIKTTI